ncbi:MAG: hypothetical protein K6B28_07270 [Lachnospiraceae bacterium]|nr:hypothetical protein [Lachnospiraceae bacterium]
MGLKGVYPAHKKDGTLYFRSSVTYKNKHISLGSFDNGESATKAYYNALDILKGAYGITDYDPLMLLSHDKYITLINFRDNDVYIKNPVYLQNTYIEYYLDSDTVFKFDIEDIFFYSSHRIQRRKGHFFVADYGMQLNLRHRYGIKSHAVAGRDYVFINGDEYDYRYENIEIINSYNGVIRQKKNNRITYKAKILINGNYLIGEYESCTEAAIAYNKAADILMSKGFGKKYELNYIDDLSPSDYARIYTGLTISDKIYKLSGIH